jgi:hypothetical protein
LNDVVSHSVDLGYRVIDEYIQQGQKAAQRFSERSYAPDTLATDTQELATRMMQYASDFTALWLEFFQVATGSAGRWPPPFDGLAPERPASAPPPPPAATPAGPTPQGAAAPRARIRVAVTSPYPTEVSLDVRPDATHQLVVQSLRAVDPDKPRLTDVSIEATGPDEPLTLRIRVPAGHPAGIYNGLIVEEDTGRPAGTVSLRIAPE